MSAPLRVGIIGTGRAGANHAAAFSRLPNVTVTGLWNRTASRAEKLAATLRQPELQVYPNWRDLIDSDQVDIISIATDPAFRLQPFAHALEAGRHVLVEKPLSVGLQESREMAELANRAGSVTAISFNWRYSPGCLTVWRAVRENQIGRLVEIHAQWRLRTNLGFRPWSSADGALREAGSHEFDRVRFLANWQFERVVCSLASAPDLPEQASAVPPSNLSASVMAEMRDGCRGSFGLMLTAGQRERRITFCGEEGTLTLSSESVVVPSESEEGGTMTLGNEVRVFRCKAGDSDPAQLAIAEADKQPDGMLSGRHTWNRLIADFVAAARRGDRQHEQVPLLPHISDGLAAQQVIHACERSHRGACWVRV